MEVFGQLKFQDDFEDNGFRVSLLNGIHVTKLAYAIETCELGNTHSPNPVIQMLAKPRRRKQHLSSPTLLSIKAPPP
ncbi:hypothetical protein NC652_013126 [Populus alba x Populus x berolinensis]|nr:hypothetical protein NC651_012767 [Populus alba x Populus x berolinensis]KAJ6929159.1 hypothetical protein NC652_013126 [Populus alba x Populus x berolinensis]